MKIRPTLILSLIGILGLAACAGNKSRLKVGETDDGEVVEAVGFAPNNESNVLETKQASLTDAHRKAVEKAVGVYVSAKTMVERSVSIENNILSKTEGYVKKFDVLEEGPTKDGLYRTKIRALVSLKDLEADLRANALLSTPKLHRPPVYVAVSESVSKIYLDGQPATRAMENALIENGFTVLGDDRSTEAQLQIQGTVTAFPFQNEGLGGFVSYRAAFSGQVVRPGTKDVVLSFNEEASGLGGSAELAGMEALKQVGKLVGDSLSEKLDSAWSSSQNLLIYVEGLTDFDQVDRAKKHIQSHPGVDDIVLRSFDEGQAQFEVSLGKTDYDELANYFEKSQSLPMTVVVAQPQMLRLKFK